MTTTPTAPRLQMQFKVRTPEFDENLHPRDRKGRFIETGAEVRIWGGQVGTVLRNVGGGKIEVERSDGRKVIVHRNYLTVTASADGGDPIEDEAEAPDVPVEEASPDAEVVPELADGEDQTLPDRGDAPDRLVAEVVPGQSVNGRTVGEYIDGPAAIDGWVVGFTESGGPIIRTDEGQDWPLLPDAVMAPDPDGPEMPPEFVEGDALDNFRLPEGQQREATPEEQARRAATDLPGDLEAERQRAQDEMAPAEQVSVRDLAPGDRIRREDGTAVTVVEVTDEVNGKVDVMVEADDGTKPFAITRTPDDTFERATDTDPAGSGRIEPKPEVPAPAPEPGPYEDPTAFDDRALAEAIRRFEGSSNALSTDEGRRQYDGLVAERDKRAATAAPAAPEVKPIDSLNPSDSGVFEEYASGREYRASAPLAPNMTTLAETEGVDPDDEVTLYRGVAEGDPADGIRPGDFVTTNRQLAQDYAGTGEVVEMQARYGDVLDDTDEPGGEEYIYRPATQEVAPETAAPETQTPEPVETPEQPAQTPEAPALSRRDETAYRNLVRVGSVLVDDEARATMLRDRAQRDSVEVTIAPSADYPDLWEARVAEGDTGGEPGPDGMIEEAPSAPIEDADERARTVAERPVDERIAEARALGYEAYIYDEMRAPALNAGVMDLINPNAQPGDADNLAIMEAFTRGYDEAGNDDLAGNLRPPEPPEETEDGDVPEGAIGAAPSRGRTTTVTLPDGTTEKRTSKSRQYTHVVVVGPAEQEARTAAFNRRADRLEAEAAKIEAAVEAGKVVKRNRGWGKDDPTDFNAYEAELVGTEVSYGNRGGGRVARTRQTGTYREVSTRCNSNGETLVYGDVPEGVNVVREENGQPVVRAREYLLAQARDAAVSKREQAATTREQGAKPDDESWSVVRWTSSEKLGRSAAEGEFSFYRDNYGQTVQVMPVDPVEGEDDQTPPAPGPEPDAVTPPTPGPEPEGGADQYADLRDSLVDVSGRPDPATMDEADVRSEAMDLEQRIDAVVTAIHGYDGEVENPRPMPPEMAAMRRRYADVRHEQGRIDRATQTGVGREMGDTFAEEEERARTLPDDEFAEALREHRAWPRNNVNTFGVERARFNGFGAGARQREENGGAFEPREWRARGEEQAPAPTPGPEPEGAEETVRRNPDELQPGDVIVDGAGDRWTIVSRDSEDDTGITFTIRGTAGNEMEQRYARGDRMNVVPAPERPAPADRPRARDLAEGDRVVVDGRPATIRRVGTDMQVDGLSHGDNVMLDGQFDDGSNLHREFPGDTTFERAGDAPTPPEGGGDRPDPIVVEAPGGPRYGRSVADLRPGDRVHTQGGNMLRERLVGAEATASAAPGGGVMYPFGNQVRTIERIEGDTIYFETEEQFSGGAQRTASIDEFRGQRDALGRTNPNKHVLVDPPEEAAPAPGPEPTPQPAEVPRLTNQKNAAKWITEQAGVSDDPEMVAAVTAALGTRIGRVQGLYPSEGWDRIKASGNADLMALTQAAHGGIKRDVTASGQRRRWDADAARENLTRLRNNDPTLPTVALVGQRAAIDVLDMDAPIRLGQPAATKRVEGIVESVTPEYTWSQRVLIVDDNGERHSAVFASGGKMPSLADPDGVGFGHPARAISNGDPDPVRFTYMRNPESLGATTPGSEFGQDVEPAGRYLNVADEFSARMARERGWETGEVQFQHPLHMDFGGGYGEEDNWKRRLSAHYDGLTGQALADAVRADGYDAIMTNDAYGDSEVVDLSNGAAEVTPDPDATPSASGLDDRWQATGGGLYRATVADLREGDVIYTEGEGTSASPVALPRNPQTGYLSDYQKRQRTVARVDGSGRARTVHFTDGTSTGPEGGDANGATYSGQAPVFGVPERDREAPAPTPPVIPPVITRQTYDGPNGTLTEGDVVARDLRGSVVLERLVAIGPQSVTIRATDGHDEGYPIYGEGDLDRILGKYRPATPEEVSRFEGTDADLRSLITPLPDLTADPTDLDDEALATAIKGIDDNIVTTPEGSDERRNLLVYRARLVGEQNRRAFEGADVDTTTPVETEAVSARDLAVGDKVIFEDGTLATIEGIEPADDLLELEYRDADGLAGSYFTDPGTSVQRLTVGGEPAPDLSPEPEQNPEPAVERTQQVLGANLAPGDRVWLGRDKAEVLAVESNDDDTVTVTFRFADRRTETVPFGREAVLDRADDEFLPDPSPLDASTATSRPVLYTYQRRNIVALGLDTDSDPMVAEAARRIRLRQPLAAAHSAALASRLADMASSRGVKPQRQRMLLRLAAANNAASIEAGGRGVDLPDMPNAASVTKGSPADAGVGDQIAFVGLRGALVQGRVVESRSMMSGRLTEVTIERPDGTTEKHMLTRRSDVYVLPDLPEPTPVQPPSDAGPELVEYGSLRAGDRIRIPNTHDLFDDERHLTEATVVEAGQSEGLAYAVLNVHSVMSNDPEQREVLTIDPRMQGIPPHVIRVERGAESADQPRENGLPSLNPTEVSVGEVAVGDWIATANRNTGTTDGIVVDVAPLNDSDGNRIGTRIQLRRPGANFGAQPNWVSVLDSEDVTVTRLIANDQNTIQRIAEEKARRTRAAREAAAARSIESVLEDYNGAMHFRVVQNALHGGTIADEHYGDAIFQAFTGGQDSTTNLDNDRLRAIGKLTTALQGHLSGEHQGDPGFNGVREAAASLAEKIVHDHHFRIQSALMNVRPTEPGETRATAGIALARSIFNPDNWGAPAMEQRDLNALARGVVNAREARDAADTGGGAVDRVVPEMPEGTNLRERMAAYRKGLSSRFGFTDSTVTTFGDFDLDSLERGEVPELTTTTARSKDRANDGGPGESTMAELDTIKAAGADLATAIDRRLAEESPDLTTAAYDVLYNQKVAANRAYEEASTRRNEEYKAAQTRAARERGYVNYQQMEQTVYRRQDPPEGKTYEDVRADFTALRESVQADPIFKAADTASNEAYQGYRTLDQQLRDLKAKMAEARANATRSVLSEVREMGGLQLRYNSAGRKNYETTTNPLRNGETMKAMRYAETNYPREWLDALNSSPKGALAIGTSKRGFFQGGIWIIRLSKDDNRNNESGWVPPRGRVATHELGHAMETVIPGLSQAEEAFLWSRTSEGEVGSRTRTKRKRIDSSTSYLDDFKESYSGKDYADGTHYELFTTGMETLFAGSDYVDEDYRNWLLGTLALL